MPAARHGLRLRPLLRECTDPSLKYLRPVTRSEAYRADITYGTNNEFGFDYLRDNMMVELVD